MKIYQRMQSLLIRFETDQRLEEELPIDPGDATAIAIGMGQVGTGAYDKLKALRGDTRIELILLASGEFRSNLTSIRALRQRDQHRKIAATATWPDEIEALQEAGADLVFSIYADAGNDFAHRVQGEFFSSEGMGGSGATR